MLVVELGLWETPEGEWIVQLDDQFQSFGRDERAARAVHRELREHLTSHGGEVSVLAGSLRAQ